MAQASPWVGHSMHVKAGAVPGASAQAFICFPSPSPPPLYPAPCSRNLGDVGNPMSFKIIIVFFSS